MIKPTNAAHKGKSRAGCVVWGWYGDLCLGIWSNGLCPPNLCMEILTPRVGWGSVAFGKPSDHGAVLVCLKKRPKHSSFDSSTLQGHNEMMTDWENRSSADSVYQQDDLEGSRDGEVNFYLYNPPVLWHFVAAAQTDNRQWEVKIQTLEHGAWMFFFCLIS